MKLNQTLLPILMVFCGPVFSQDYAINPMKDHVYTQSVNNMETIIISAENEVDTTITKTAYSLGFKVKDSDSETYSFETSFKDMSLVNVVKQDSFVYNPQLASSYDLLSSIMSKIIDKPFFVTVNRDGSINKIDQLSDVFTNAVSAYPENMRSQFVDMFNRWYGEEVITRNLEEVAKAVSNEKQQNGHWVKKRKLRSDATRNLEITYSLKDISPGTCTIAGKGLDDKEKSTLGSDDSKLKLISNASFETEITYDKGSGWLMKGIVTEVNKGEMKVPGLKDDVKGWFPFEMISKTKISGMN